jgi:hypothetical protein
MFTVSALVPSLKLSSLCPLQTIPTLQPARLACGSTLEVPANIADSMHTPSLHHAAQSMDISYNEVPRGVAYRGGQSFGICLAA